MLNHPIQTRVNENFDTYHDRIIIECGDLSLSYSQLDEKSNRIASTIIDKGIKKDSFIGILLEDRIELISTILGILKAGCVFVPLDSRFPAERLKIMLHSTNTKFLFCDSHILDETLLLSILETQVTSAASSNRPTIQYHLNDSIYIYFSSGTTGKPKAIIGQNKGLHHFIDWEIQRFGIMGRFRLSQLTSPCHDGFLREIFIPLFTGGTISIPPGRETLLDPHRLKKWLEQSAVNLIHCTPSMFNIFNSSLLNLHAQNYPALKYLMLVGERIIPAELSSWYAVFGERIQLVNFYGHTETTLVKMYYSIRPGDSEREFIPIGQPITDTEAIILDEHLSVCSQGKIGEIYIQTPYMAIGYCNEPELTARCFIKNPLKMEAADPVYKSGDLGRVLPAPTGQEPSAYLIEFMGRIDRQVKIRGVRVELSEIENELLKHEVVSRCAADFHEDQHDRSRDGHLTVYYIPHNNMAVSHRELWTYLEKRLPHYMLPSQFVRLDHMPLTQNNKIDYEALRSLREISARDFTPPGNATEQKLWEIWCDILRIDNVSINENFLQVGGNSLNIMTLIAKIYKEFDVRIALGDIFQNPTIEKQAAIIQKTVKETYCPIEPTELKEYYALSPAQQRFYVLQQMDPQNTGQNQPAVFVLEGDSDSSREQIQSTFHRMIKRHESLRTSFQTVDDEPVQRIHEEIEFEIEYYDISTDYTSDADKIIRHFVRPFDLAEAPLLRAGLVKLEQGKSLLLVDMHHIIVDEVSLTVFLQDFMKLYQGEELPKLRLHYRDFSQWHQQNEQNPLRGIMKQEAYWLKVFEGEIPSLNLPGDYHIPPADSYACSHFSFNIDKRLYAGLKNLLEKTSITLYMALLAGYFILLARYTRQEDIVITSPVSGRNHPDLESIMGVFLNMLAIRIKPEGHKTLKEFIEEVKSNILNAMENSDFRFEDLVSRLGVDQAPMGNPLSETAFNMISPLNNHPPHLPGNAPNAYHAGNLKISSYLSGAEVGESPFKLSLHAMDDHDEVQMSFHYATAFFKKATIEKISKNYIEIITKISEMKVIRLEDIKISHDLLAVKATHLRDNQKAFNF
ncbi:MAG: hypothetical protein QG657_3120 [Acidobacteriota bacterium]|nr:hypothetical protein [Acidobacteriota bacterium]